jgi:hypothetical protein
MVTGQMEPGWGEGQYTSGHGLSLRVLSIEPDAMQMQCIISKHLDQKVTHNSTVTLLAFLSPFHWQVSSIEIQL